MLTLKGFSYAFSRFNRKRKLRFLKRFILKGDFSSTLIIGAKPDSNSLDFDNYIEKGVFDLLSCVTISGLESSSSFWENWVQADGRNLPFEDKSFDFVLSNAVIEHVGDEQDQMRFVSELARVGKCWVFTTPNRLFPIESHTQVILRHMRRGWSNGDVTRLLSKSDLKSILPPGSKIKGNFLSPTFICFNPDFNSTIKF